MNRTTIVRAAAAIVSAAISLATIPAANAAATTATECAAKPYHVWLEPHKAGEINAKTNREFNRDSSGSCRLDVKAVRAAIDAGKVK